ncbi:MAG: pyridoxal phosphate-dependent aminotransferase [Gammaproteobacteria bacterium]|nr:pyridoxal phosphate-dependent aminotransferase [Gammaproteobacteria bacterium]
MTPSLSTRVQRIKPSPTLSLTVRVNQLKAQGHDIINLGVGEPDFDTPNYIKTAGIKAIESGATKYTAVDGISSLKEAVIHKFKRENKLTYEPKQILISSGSKQALYNLAQALLDEGDEVIIPAPYWVSYPDIIFLAGGVPVFIPTTLEQHFKITPEQLEKAITPKTKLLILNSPNNPTGMIYTHKELEGLAQVLLKHPHIFIASDDMYEHIQWSGSPFSNIVNACPALYERSMVFNGVSKTYAMTGWRIGYCAGPQYLIHAMSNVQAQSTSNANSMAQLAAVTALNGPQDFVAEMQRTYHKRHTRVFQALQAIPGVKCLPSMGSFYIFPDFSDFLGKIPGIDHDLELADYLLMEAKVALIPGSAFGAPGCLRLSFVVEMNILDEAMTRIRHALSKFSL